MWEYSDPIFENVDLRDLNVDQAYVNVTSHLNHRIWMYALSEDCIKCPFTKFRDINGNRTVLAKFDAARQLAWQFFDEDVGQYAYPNDTSFCTIIPGHVGQFGVYNIEIDKGKCDFRVSKEPVSIYLSMLYVILILIGALVLIYGSNRLYRRFKNARRAGNSSDDSLTTAGSLDSNLDNELNKTPTKTPKQRVRSLDTFRGIAIVVMIFVNSGGGHYWWIEHATWNGIHVADLVFPWFLWIMGVCIPMSVKSQLNRNVPKRNMIWNVFVRSVKLFLIGMCMHTAGGPKFSEIRIMGVLQRFGIAYFVVGTIHILLSKPIEVLPQAKIKRALYDIYVLAYEWIAIIAIVIVHTAIIFGLDVPECGSGYLGPGGKHEWNAHQKCIGGVTGYIDDLILGSSHIYQWPTARSTYDSLPFDPEGLFGCLTTFLQVFLGLQCGITLMVYTQWQARIKRWLLWAVALGIAGGALCLFSQDGGIIPINKNLWSLSFVFVTASFAFVLLTFCYLIIDVRHIWSGTPLIYAGMNSIVMFVGHEILDSMLPWHWRFDRMNTHFILLLRNTWTAALWVVVAYWLHRKKIFISI